MAYLVQKTRVASLTVGGVDYTSSLISWQVSDASANRNGLVTTTGEMVLGQRPGASDIEDYDRNLFKRGVQVVLDMTEPGGSSYRHPRGLLYVISVSYNVESEQLTVELGCRLALMALIDDAETVLPLVPVPLDPAQKTIQNCSGSFAAAGQVLYQDNQGDLVSRNFFGTDGLGSVEAGDWVSVLGETALSVAPLNAAGAIPDQIELSYQIPSSEVITDGTGRVEISTETSQYFISYPSTIFKRTTSPETNIQTVVDGAITVPIPSYNVGTCGNVPSAPNTELLVEVEDGEQVPVLCSDQYVSERVDVYMPATRVATSETVYGALGAQASYVKQEATGPAIEANAGYYADKYAYCVGVYGYGCNPSGSCPYEGMETVLLSRVETFNEYDEADNSLKRTVQDTFLNKLSAVQTSDYRSGATATGTPQDFNGNLPTDQLYRASRVVTDYYQEGNSNVQVTTTFSSMTSRGIGINAGISIDALDGIKTTVKRVSTTITTLDIQPDTVNSPKTQTAEKVSTIYFNGPNYTQPPTEAGPYILEESIPVPLLGSSEAEIDGWVASYSHYLKTFIEGDLYGLQIAESMRPGIVTSWYPGKPFRYVDTSNNKVLAMRMDACTWGVTQEEAIVVTNGIWTGYSSGTLALQDNLVGNSAPNLGGGAPTAPPGAGSEPSISDDVVGGSVSFVVNINLNLSSSAFTFGGGVGTAPNPTDLTANAEMSFIAFVSGVITETGGLLETTGTGGIPLEYDGSLLISAETLVDADVFS